MADRRRLAELGMVPPLAAEVAAQIAAAQSAGLQIGTTGTTAMAGNKVPTATQRGGVLLGTAVPNCTVAADGTSAGTQLNLLLAQLRAVGVIS